MTSEEVGRAVVAKLRPAMRVAIGDSTPRQYDRADRLAEAIYEAVVEVLDKRDYEEQRALRGALMKLPRSER